MVLLPAELQRKLSLIKKTSEATCVYSILHLIHIQIDKHISESQYRKLKSHLVINGDR